MAKRPSYKRGPVCNTDVSGAVAGGWSDLEELKNEMEEWRDNMENNNLGSTPKFDEVSSCCDELDSLHGDEPSVPDGMDEIPVQYHEMVPIRRGRGASRSMRASNIADMWSAAADAIRADIARHEEAAEKADEDEDEDAEETATEDGEEGYKWPYDKDDAEELADALENAADTLQGIDFPGMY